MTSFYETILEDKDERHRVRMGRFSEAEARYWEHLISGPSLGRFGGGRSRQPRSKVRIGGEGLSNPALRDRLRVLSGEYPVRGKEVIVKAAGAPKTIGGVRGAVRYIGRICQPEGDEDDKRVPLFDGWGREVFADEIKDELARWGLLKDSDNLSRWARELKAEGTEAWRTLPTRERFRNVQARHFIWSIAADNDDEATIEKLRRATLVTLDRLFTARGFQCLWALHQDHSEHPHVHVMVGAISETGERLRCDIHGDYLYSMRVELADNLRTAGLDYIATCREDRTALREDILAGVRPLRFSRSMAQRHTRAAPLWVRAPKWWESTGTNIHRERHGKQRGRLASWVWAGVRQWDEWIDALNEHSSKSVRDLHAELSSIFEHPTSALNAYLSLAMEEIEDQRDQAGSSAKTIADWHLLHRPWTFGNLKRWPLSDQRRRQLKRAVKTILLPERKRQPRHRPAMSLRSPINVLRWRQEVAKGRTRVEVSILRLCRIAERRGCPIEVLEPVRETLGADLKVYPPDLDQVRRYLTAMLETRPAPLRKAERDVHGRHTPTNVPSRRSRPARTRSRPARGVKGSEWER
ncbi:MAG: hypothetical protein CMM61_09810 [Rhodospirillaceae bacterium]|nr:hypothetical protein [Rhodospirillaceae bacterium]